MSWAADSEQDARVKPTFRKLALLALTFALAGCDRTPPLGLAVRADSPLALSLWRSKVQNDLTLDQWTDFDTALQEIRYGIMSDGEATGSAAVEQVLQTRIDGFTVRDVMWMGFELKLQRLAIEGDKLDAAIRYNAAQHPVNSTEADRLAVIHDAQVARLRQIDDDFESTDEKLDALLRRPHVPRLPRGPLPDSPRVQEPGTAGPG
jgi:hypothetical protein